MSTNQDEIRAFLTSRRARLSPESVGLPAGRNRRVAGLRRGEVATLAGVSVEYYARIERGVVRGVSGEVLTAIADALQLDDAERSHLFDLGLGAQGAPIRTRGRANARMRPTVQWALDSMTLTPAMVRNNRLDVLADNALFRTLYDVAYRALDAPLNLARLNFLYPDVAQELYGDWQTSADITVEILRTEAGRNPRDKGLHDLIGELSTLSEEFRRRWGSHNVRHHASGTKLFRHPDVGTLNLVYDTLDLVGTSSLNMVLYSAEPGSDSEQSLRLLASLAATNERPVRSEQRPASAGWPGDRRPLA